MPPVYFDNHSTTRVDPRVAAAMWPYFSEQFGNAGSVSHSFGWDARDAVAAARAEIAAALGAGEKEIVFTSGATESNNLALRGAAERYVRKGKHVISVATEHKAVLDPLAKLERQGHPVTILPVAPAGTERAGLLDVNRVAETIRPDTILVSVMLANNEIGVIQPVAEIGRLCKARGVLLHCDATQAVGKIPVDVDELQVDLLSCSAHKLYGPKGIGALYVRRRNPPVKLSAQIDGGGQEGGLRSGTLNVPGIVGFATALRLCLAEMPAAAEQSSELRQRLWNSIAAGLANVHINGPALNRPEWRLPNNLNVSFHDVDGEALMMSMRDVAVSSGSACTSANPEPSHVLRALGLSDDLVRSSLRFGLGRFNTADEVDFAADLLIATVQRLRAMRGR